MRYQLGLLALLVSPACLAQSAADLFLDVTQFDQKAAVQSAQAARTGVSGMFNPPTLCALGYAFCPLPIFGAGGPTAGNGWTITAWRLPVKDRQAVVIQFPWNSTPYLRSSYSDQWLVKQNGQFYLNTMFYGGGGAATQYSEIAYYYGDTTPYGVRNYGNANTFFLLQDPAKGAQYNPAQAFELVYVGNTLPANGIAGAPIIISMPALPTVSASFSPSQLTQGGSYTLSVNSTGAASVNMVCTGAAATNESFTGGSFSVTRVAGEVGATSCTFTASSAGGVNTTSASRNVQALGTPPNVPPPTNPCQKNPAACG